MLKSKLKNELKSKFKNRTLILIIILITSLLVNFYFVLDIIIKNNDNFQVKELIEVKYKQLDRKFFPQKIKLKDYSSVKYHIEEEWKSIIKNIREFHKVPSLIDNAFKDKDLCAGYIWSLSEKIWGIDTPFYIWMMDRETRKPAKAWELLNSYKYLWADALIDLSKKIDLSKYKTDFYKMVSDEDILNFFNFSFSEESLFWDVGFLYKETWYIAGILEEWVYNSHITKNIWLSEFTKQITFKDNLNNHNLLLEKLFNSNAEIVAKLGEVISKYKFKLNWKDIFYNNWSFYYLIDQKYIWEKVIFNILDNLSYKDITVVHYFENVWRVNWLLDFVLSWEFFPVNIISINSRLIEKI